LQTTLLKERKKEDVRVDRKMKRKAQAAAA